jgi:hypothetical protein
MLQALLLVKTPTTAETILIIIFMWLKNCNVHPS